jgi:ATP-dependent 26S proteasome regulatory subunit
MPTAATAATNAAAPFATDAASLSPTQAAAYERLAATVAATPVTLLLSEGGLGKTTLIEALLAAPPLRGRGGLRISARELIEPQIAGGGAMEEIFHRAVDAAISRADTVVIDDLDPVILTNRMTLAYPRPFYLQVPLQAAFERVRALGKRLVLVARSRDGLVPVIEPRAVTVSIPTFTMEDYRFFLEAGLGAERLAKLDLPRLFSFAPKLSAYQLVATAALLRDKPAIDDDLAMALIESQVMTSNVSLGEVAQVAFSDLKGFDEIVEALETHVVTPLLFDAQFSELNLMPKRGVLLYGPPGTGKTSVGRALAHRLKGKFFMIDGSFISDLPPAFYGKVQRVFDEAKRNTPSVIFIDDADVLMNSKIMDGLNRYLLSQLDGIETETAGKVMVMMTAMDPNQMPQALLRSGRIELWLETKLPDAKARREILEVLLASLPPVLSGFTAEQVMPLTEDFNAADLKRLVADLKALYARDVVKGAAPRTIDAYLAAAAAGVRANKAKVQAAQEGKLQTTEATTRQYYGSVKPVPAAP